MESRHLAVSVAGVHAQLLFVATQIGHSLMLGVEYKMSGGVTDLKDSSNTSFNWAVLLHHAVSACALLLLLLVSGGASSFFGCLPLLCKLGNFSLNLAFVLRMKRPASPSLNSLLEDDELSDGESPTLLSDGLENLLNRKTKTSEALRVSELALPGRVAYREWPTLVFANATLLLVNYVLFRIFLFPLCVFLLWSDLLRQARGSSSGKEEGGKHDIEILHWKHVSAEKMLAVWSVGSVALLVLFVMSAVWLSKILAGWREELGWWKVRKTYYY